MDRTHTTVMPPADGTCSILDLIGAVVGTFLATSVVAALIMTACVIYGKRRSSEFQVSGLQRKTFATGKHEATSNGRTIHLARYWVFQGSPLKFVCFFVNQSSYTIEIKIEEY
jgi:hypothetical protein